MDTFADSLFISIRSIQYAYSCSLSEIHDLRSQTIRRANESLIIKHRILDEQFNNNFSHYQSFCNDFIHRQGQLDEKLYLLDALAMSVNRTVIVISSLSEDQNSPILKFQPNVTKPPFILGLYDCSGSRVFRPFYINQNSEFNLKQLQQFQIVYFWSKAIGKEHISKSILELELMALLLALNALIKLIGNSPLLAITDSKALFLLYANPLRNSSTKIARWSDKLMADFPALQ